MNPSWPSHFSPEIVSKAFGGGRLSSYCLAVEAWRRGLEVAWVRGDMRNFVVEDQHRRVRFNDSRPQSLTPPKDYKKLIDKWETKRHLEAHGVPVPPGVLIDDTALSAEELDALADRVGFPLVIKPNSGTMGQSVFSNIRTREELHRLFNHIVAHDADTSILMEQHIAGDDWRVVVVGDEVVAAALRVPANVTGDGARTIDGLIRSKNAARAANPFLSKGLIRVDVEIETLLEEQGLGPMSIPEDGQHVWLRRIANASAGGDVIDRTDTISEEMARAAVDAVRAVPNIHVAGVDFLADSTTGGAFSIIEMNSRPHIPLNMYPTEGIGRDLPAVFIDHFFPESSRAGRTGDEKLILDLEHAEHALLTRQAAKVTMTPLPRHHYPSRQVWTIPAQGISALSVPRRSRVLRTAASHSVSGGLWTTDDAQEVLAVVGAADDERGRRFMDQAAALLGIDPGEPEDWTGPLAAGFSIDEALVG